MDGRTRKGAKMFARNSVGSVVAFAFDFAMLVALVELADMAWYPAATIAFLLANGIHYALAQTWIFPDSDRALVSGFTYFLINALIGLVITLAIMGVLVELAGVNYMIARVVASVVAGIAVFFLNAIFNFKAL
jgi:putative flippase GtrA